jgi:GTP pyrophosphokinase
MRSSATTDQTAAVTLEQVVAAFRAHHPEGDVDLITRAYEVAAEAHEGQLRKTGDPYISHPLAVALMLAEHGLDEATVAAALLHDTVEDTPVTLDDLRSEF